MLVLTRRLGEQIQIGPDIMLTVVRVHAHGVSIGIDAPLASIVQLRPENSYLIGAEAQQLLTAADRAIRGD